jgi:hypothetical protein
MAIFRASDRSTCVSPNPRRSLRPSDPCTPSGGTEKASAFNDRPPGKLVPYNQTGLLKSRSGLRCEPSTALWTCALKGSPVRATTTESMDQFPNNAPRSLDRVGPGISKVSAAERLWRTSKSDEALAEGGQGFEVGWCKAHSEKILAVSSCSSRMRRNRGASSRGLYRAKPALAFSAIPRGR